MDILEINLNTLANLFEQFPESFSGLSINGNNLVCNGEMVDISDFNINYLLSEDTSFATMLGTLKAQDIFNIIRLHVLTLESKKKYLMKEVDAKQKPTLITFEDFSNLINSNNPLSDNEKHQLNSFYNYLETLSRYEECTYPELRSTLMKFNALVYDLEYGGHETLNEKQQEAINRAHGIMARKNETAIGSGSSKEKEEDKKLELKPSNAGSVSIFQVLAIVLVIILLLTIVTLSVIN